MTDDDHTPTTPPSELPPGLNADGGWFHVLRSMFVNGEVAQMGLPALGVYLAIKSHTAMRDGSSFPGQDRLAEQLGVSIPTVKRALAVLVARGHIRANKRGRSNAYTVVDHVPLRDITGAQVATVAVPYVPMQFATLLDAVKRAAAAGGPLTLNLTFVTGAQPTVHVHGSEALPELPQD